MLGLLLPATTDASSDFTYDTDVRYSVNADGITDVTQHYTITNNTLLKYLTQIKLSTPTDKVSGLSADYDNGGAIGATAAVQNSKSGDVAYRNDVVTLAFPKQIYGLGRSYSFTVHFRAGGLVDTRGSAHTVYVPAIQPTAETQNYQVHVSVPQGFGGAHFTGAKLANAEIDGDRQVYTFNRDEVIAHALALSFGDTNVYKLNFKFPLNNDSFLPRNMTLTLPPDLNNQKVTINSLSPAPFNTRLDVDGNILADYHMAPRQHLVVDTDVTTEVRYRDYDLSASGFKKDIPANLVHEYTEPTQYWQTGGAVGTAAAKLNDPKAPVINNVKAMYQYVISTLSYNDEKVKFNIRQGSAKALANPSNAVCLEYADLLVSMLRSQGIPARMPVGYGYTGSLKQSAAVDDSLHAWVEAYVPGIGWMTLDPTWGEKFDEFGHSDLDHMAFSVWGRKDQLPSAVMAGSTDQGYQYEHAQLAYIQTTSAPATARGSVRAQRQIIVPGIALEGVTVTAPLHTASDGNLVTLGSSRWEYGSLAPGQRVTQHRLAFGFGSGARAIYTSTQNGAGVRQADAAETTSWLGFVGVVILLAAGSGAGLWRRRRRSVSPSSDLASDTV